MRVYVERRTQDGQNVLIVPARITRLPPVFLTGEDLEGMRDSVRAVIEEVSGREHLLRHPDTVGPG